ncbi:MAG: ORF6N domain-containing protein [Verrucomicrobiota bacterium]|nr:ORF6N domain-containing protein [Verrucomicrobiota bacterium]
MVKNKGLTPYDNNLRSKIQSIRDLQVMLDYDLAELYGVETRRLREQIKRNPKRFPKDFMFRLTNDEIDFMVSQNATPSKQQLGGSKPYVFTEQGIASLSSVLTSDKAIEVNIKIMRAFVAMRKVMQHHDLIFQKLDNIEQKYLKFRLDSDIKFEKIFDAIEVKDIKPKQGIFYDGQVFDAYVFISDLIKQAQKSIVLIDNYIDDTVLTLFLKRNKNCKLTIYTQRISKQLRLDLDKHNRQYTNVDVKIFKSSHDRFLIIDKRKFYHIGASLKDLGKKWFAFFKFEKETFSVLKKLNLTNKKL